MNWILKLAEEFEKTVKDISVLERDFSGPKPVQSPLPAPEPQLEEDDEDAVQQKLIEDAEEKMLMELGITPLAVSDKDNSYLDQGYFARVYRVLFEGRPAVAKVTSNKSDIENLVKLSELKTSVGELGKHLATVYASFVHVLPNGRKVYVAVVEELAPLNPYARISLFSKTHRKKELLGRFKDQYFVRNFVNAIFPDTPETIPDQVVRKMKRAISLLLLKENFSKEVDGSFIEDLVKDINLLIQQILPADLQEALMTRSSSQIYYDLTDFLGELGIRLHMSLVKLVDNSAIFPVEEDRYSEIWANSMPESKSLMKLLYKLKEMGIYWSDLHGKNLMERPGTRDIVIADPGLFQVFF